MRAVRGKRSQKSYARVTEGVIMFLPGNSGCHQRLHCLALVDRIQASALEAARMMIGRRSVRSIGLNFWCQRTVGA
jgi:hypothetical protein